MKYDIVKLMARRKIRWKKRWVSGDSGGRLTFRSKKAGALKDYRIYGRTSRNLFDGELAQGYYKDTAGSSNDLISTNVRVAGTTFIPVSTGNKMTLTYESAIDITRYLVYYYNNNKELINVMGWYNNGLTITIPDNVSFIRHVWCARDKGTYGTILVADISNIMLNMGSTALPYEPYGKSVGDVVAEGEHTGEYVVPVTISNGTDTQTVPIYIPEQIRKAGDEAEYISYADQKLHRVGADDIDVTLPELPTLTGTNVLSVGTAVQPSRVEVKGRIKAVGQETEPEPEAAEAEQEAAEAEQEAAEAEQE